MTVAFPVTPLLDPGALVGEDRAGSTPYTDPAIVAAEMSRIVENTWVRVAHASEIPKGGDFKMGQVGLQPVIVVRDRKVWDRVQHGAQGAAGMPIMLHRGLSHEEVGPEGRERGDASAETGMRAGYRQWKRMMEA